MQKDILSGKKIILGVTGCIAAYKSALIVRELVKRNAEVKVVMTPSSGEFITPLTLSSLSKNKVIVNMFPPSQKDGTDLSTWHIDYALWADVMLIAPATVNTVAKLAHGFADNALTTLALALRCPLIISPAADVDMYQNPITQKNILELEKYGAFIINAEEGELASGLKGKGRLPEVDKIIDAVEIVLSGIKKDLAGKKILVTAGPTFEDIDPVRFIGNRSSGKMGFEIAKSAYLRGADVTLISGPTSLSNYPEIKSLKVRSADEMKKAVEKEFKKNDVLIMSAAVADYKPSKYSTGKIKKEQGLNSIQLKETDDILAGLNKENKIVIGFALETNNELANAKKKLGSKNLDMVVLNSLNDKQSGFEFDTNKITLLKKSGQKISLPLMSKFQAANKILSELLTL
ncbi:MAG: bifunctional phosphopantothenoylcysteine decarboxylase/phosphopantothenate--cysteine ligase CoaBC [Ignavibacteriales bacterium]|nr:MAG: bifunctional phosphopantothenoylcysteine decarboxylase/phosphopantothenate--cysteine ligase CoaBC [Ignavibacteriales bacterium]